MAGCQYCGSFSTRNLKGNIHCGKCGMMQYRHVEVSFEDLDNIGEMRTCRVCHNMSFDDEGSCTKCGFRH